MLLAFGCGCHQPSHTHTQPKAQNISSIWLMKQKFRFLVFLLYIASAFPFHLKKTQFTLCPHYYAMKCKNEQQVSDCLQGPPTLPPLLKHLDLCSCQDEHVRISSYGFTSKFLKRWQNWTKGLHSKPPPALLRFACSIGDSSTSIPMQTTLDKHHPQL